MTKVYIRAEFKAIDKMTLPLKRMIKKSLESELKRKLSDYEFEHILGSPGYLTTGTDWNERANPAEDIKAAHEAILKQSFLRPTVSKEIFKQAEERTKRNVLFDESYSEEFKSQYLGKPWREEASNLIISKAVQCGNTEMTTQQALYLLSSRKPKFSLKRLFKRWFKKWQTHL